ISEDLKPEVLVRVVEPAAGLPRNLDKRDDEPASELGRWEIAPIPARPWPAIVPVDELEKNGEPDVSVEEFRTALRHWDLTTCPSDQSLLVRFAATEGPARLRAAEQLLRDIEYVSPWPGGNADDRPALR